MTASPAAALTNNKTDSSPIRMNCSGRYAFYLVWTESVLIALNQCPTMADIWLGARGRYSTIDGIPIVNASALCRLVAVFMRFLMTLAQLGKCPRSGDPQPVRRYHGVVQIPRRRRHAAHVRLGDRKAGDRRKRVSEQCIRCGARFSCHSQVAVGGGHAEAAL